MLALVVALLLQDPIAGDWHGALDVGGQKLRLSLHVAKEADGSLSATLDSVDQGAMGLKLDAVTLTDGAFAFELRIAKGTYAGRFDAAKARIEGTWTQGSLKVPLNFTREPHVAPRRPQTPAKPYPYAEEEVTFENAGAKLTLAGTLTLPHGAGPHPAVALVSGSGPQDRDESIMGHKPFLILADHLTRAGIAVLRYDDRGVGKSTGDFAKGTSADFATDALAAVAYLRGRKDVDPARVGIVGHSEGGLIAPMCATASKDVAFIVLMAGPGVPGERILISQTELIGEASGMSDEMLAKQLDVAKRIYAIVRQEKDGAAARQRIGALLAEAEPGLDPEMIKGRVEAVLSPWFRAFLESDPAPALRKVACPVLAVNGEKDLQVPCRENLDAIAAALKAGGHANAKTIAFKDLNHLFQTCKTGSPAEYATIEETFAPVALEAISKWILEVAAPKR